MWVALFYDSIIAMGIIVPTLVAYFLLRDRRDPQLWSGRNRFITLFFSFGMLFGAAIIIWGSFVEPHIITVKQETLDIKAALKKPIRIAIFSDIQVGPYVQDSFVRRVVEKVKKLNPDFILYPGDFVENNGSQHENEALYLTALKELAQQYRFIAVNGNHEHGFGAPIKEGRTGSVVEKTHPLLESYGIEMLNNKSATVTIDGQSLVIYGVDELWAGKTSFKEFAPTSTPAILMGHNPDVTFAFKHYAKETGVDPHAFDLVVAGHTHGGQIRLPLIGPIASANTLLPKKYYKGFSWWDDTPLYISGGLGSSSVRARLFNPPEIVLLTVY